MELEMGQPSASKRNRSANWSEDEKMLLTSIIKKRIDRIECKDVSKTQNDAKNRAWDETVNEFNKLNSVYRDRAQIYNQWRNTKNILKKRDRQYRQAQKANASGRPPTPPSQEEVEIMELMPDFSIENNSYDSDYNNTVENNSIQENNTSFNNFNTGETTYTPRKPAAPTPAYLLEGREKKKNANNKYEEEIFKLAKTEREEKIQQAQERHKMKMEILALEKQYWQTKIQTITEKDY